MLSTGLLVSVGGGAIAAADTDSGAPAGTQAAEGATQGAGTGTAGTGGSQSTTTQQAGQAETGAMATTGAAGAGQTGTTGSTMTAAESDSEFAEQFSEAAVNESEGSGSGSTVTTTNSTPPAEPAVLASDSNVPAAGSDVPAANSTVATSNSNVVAQAATSASQLMNAFQPVSNAINTVANVVGSVPGKLAALPTSTTPVTDVITSVQDMLTTVAGAVVPLAQVPSDLYALLGVPGAVPPLIGQSGATALTVDGAAPLFGSQATQPAVVPAVNSDGPLFGTMTPPPDLGVIAPTGLLVQQLSLHGMAQLAPEGLRPLDARTLLEHVVAAVLVPASLTALAALALPGIAGLLVVSAAGVRVGYRQAKAGLALRTAGIARFAGSGPLGVVRSGSLIALHTRTPRAKQVSRPEAMPATVRHLERVA